MRCAPRACAGARRRAAGRAGAGTRGTSTGEITQVITRRPAAAAGGWGTNVGTLAERASALWIRAGLLCESGTWDSLMS